MNPKKMEIVEYVAALVGVVVLLAYIHLTAQASHSPDVGQVSPLTMTEAVGTIRVDLGHTAVRFREVVVADAQM